MNSLMKGISFALITFATTIPVVNATGARLELRPVGHTVLPPDATHPDPYIIADPNTSYHVQVFLVDTGNPQASINFRLVGLDSSVSTQVGVSTFSWVNPSNIGVLFSQFPLVSWTYPLTTPIPSFMLVLPNDGEVMIGEMDVVTPSGLLDGVLDLVNADNPNIPNAGANIVFGFGGAGDPVTNWSAFGGEITGGRLGFVSATEPPVAGVRMELRPIGQTVLPPDAEHPDPYILANSNSTYRVEVVLVDSGNPQGDISFRLVGLDSSVSTEVSVNTFDWVNPGGVGVLFSQFPLVSWTYPLTTPIVSFMLTLPNNGEVKIGEMNVVTPAGLGDGVLDLVNASNPNVPNAGANIVFGFGGVGDPVINWSAFDGQITGGRLGFVGSCEGPTCPNDEKFFILSSSPANGTIDARQPSELQGGPAQGIQTVELEFNGECAPDTNPCEPCDCITLHPESYSVLELGGDGVGPQIASVVKTSTNHVRINLSEPIQPGAWTTIVYNPTSSPVTFGYLPADVNGDETSAPIDILYLINSLNGVVPRPIESTDIDRNGITEVPDIMREIDLLVGAQAFDPWFYRTLPPLP